MLNFRNASSRRRPAPRPTHAPVGLASGPGRAGPTLEPLESRRLMSGTAFAGHRGGGGDHGGSPGGPASVEASIAFSLAPTAVQTALTSLASTAGDAAPSSTTTVRLGNSDGIETYSLDEGSTTTGVTTTPARLTVDAAGHTVTAAATTTTTFGLLTSTAVTNELTAIAAALNLTAPTATTAVDVRTTENGAVTYSLSLAPTTSTSTTSTTTTDTTHDVRIIVDANGNPAGDEQVPLSVLPAAVQTALETNAPAGATALTSASLVQVRTDAGVILYTAQYGSTGTQTRVTVNTAGVLTSLPSTASVAFSTLPAAAQAELQTLATADGYTSVLAATQTVEAHTEATGAVIYSVTLSETASTASATDQTSTITLASDAAGNPTVAAGEGEGSGGYGGGDYGGGDCDPTSGAGGTAGTTTTSTTGTTATTGTTTLPTSRTTATVTATSKKAIKLAALAARKAAAATALQQKKAAKAAKLAARKAAALLRA